jgi:dolichol-phosphate mannosyltransferase
MPPLVIVPTYNERENLPLLTAMLLGVAPVRLMIVDDRSPDGTGDIADILAAQYGDRVTVIHRTGPRGLGRSYIDGMQAAIALDADPIVQMDADFSHNPADVPRLIAASEGAGLVVGSRYIAGGQVVNWPMRRVLLSRFANWYVRTLTHLQVHDCTSGFRCWRRSVLERMPLSANRSEGYSFQVEMTWEARRLGCLIVEVPITFSERREGASKLSSGVVFESAILPWRLALRGRFQ